MSGDEKAAWFFNFALANRWRLCYIKRNLQRCDEESKRFSIIPAAREGEPRLKARLRGEAAEVHFGAVRLKREW